MNNGYPHSLLFAFLTMVFLPAMRTEAQEVKIVKKIKIYKQQVHNDSNHRLVEIKSLIPEIVYDLKYATKDNFTGRQLYPSGYHTYLRLPAAAALAKVAAQLRAQGFNLKIYDAYRPYAVTKKMWDLIRDERYVAHPAKGSGHNRGLAIDLTLIDPETGAAADMGTSFDHFSDTAHHAFQQLPAQVLQRRRLLRQTMEAAGFRALETEWWHYSWPNNRAYDVLDLSFSAIRKVVLK